MSIISFILGFTSGLVLGICASFLIDYTLSLRRQLKALQAATQPPQPTLHAVQATIDALEPRHPERNPPPEPMRFSGIGPTDIASRHQYEREQAARVSTPPFADRGVLNPSLREIHAAAREATEGEKPN